MITSNMNLMKWSIGCLAAAYKVLFSRPISRSWSRQKRSTSNAWSSFFGLPFICSASGWPPGVVESLAAGK